MCKSESIACSARSTTASATLDMRGVTSAGSVVGPRPSSSISPKMTHVVEQLAKALDRDDTVEINGYLNYFLTRRGPSYQDQGG